jgi:hypothetical protein
MCFAYSKDRPSIRRRISVYVSSKRRRISSIQQPHKISAITRKDQVQHGRLELDSHADTIVFGKNCVALHFTGRECDVQPYTEAYDSINSVPIATGATAWTSLSTGTTYILVFHEGLWMPEQMEHTLVNPNQLRHFGIQVQDNPYDKSPLYLATEDEDFILPLQTLGTNIIADTRTPTDHELHTCKHIHLSSKHHWNPHSVRFPTSSRSVEEEMEMRRGISGVKMTVQDGVQYEDAETQRILYNKDDIQRRMINSVNVVEIPSNAPTVSANVSNVLTQESIQDVPSARTFTSKERQTSVKPEDLSERWGIGLKQATETLKKTTQRIVRSALLPLGRRYKADRVYEKPRLAGKWYTDTMDGRTVSKDGNRYGQVFANKKFFATIYPMDSKAKAGEALRVFCEEFGVPDKLTFDGSKEQNGKNTEFMKQIRKNDIDYHTIEPERHNQNPAEGVIREIRRKWLRTMVRKRVPRKFWDYGARWTTEIMQRTYTRAGRLDASIPLEDVTGETVDISEYLDFGFYDRIWFHENAGLGERKLGRWLGVSKRIGSQMAYYVLAQNGQIMSRTSVQRITNLESREDTNKQAFTEFDVDIKQRLRDDNFPVEGDKPSPEHWAELIEYDQEFLDEFDHVISSEDVPEADDGFTAEVMDDTYLNMEVALPRDEPGPEFARVTKRLKDAEGRPIGTANDNPILDTRMYEVEYSDGHTASLAANAIAINMFAQVDDEGNRHVLFDEIVDYRTDGTEIKQQEAFITNKSGTKRRRETTKGWEMLIQWKDGSTTWVALKDMKESYPVQVAEYAVLSKLSQEPAFAWWVPFVLKKRNRIISKIKSKYWVRTHKFGIRIPKSVVEAKKLDEKNGDTLWWDSICKEMKNVRIAFEIFEGSEAEIPPGYQKVNCHMIFDVKMGENFRRKARMVAGGHTTEAPATLTYSSVVSRDSVRIALTIAALNDLKILACDIQNAYLTAQCREKIWTVAGPEFGSDRGKIMLVVRALYGLKSSGAAFRALLAETLHELGYRPTKADPDVWIRAATKPNGFKYYEYILCYVDDVLSLSDDPKTTMLGIQDQFKLKDDKIEEPENYLGAVLAKMTMNDGSECWTMSSEKYCKAAVTNVEEKLAKSGRRLPTKCGAPLTSGYKPELDVSQELKADGLNYYQELIGVLRWAVELGRVDLLLETSLMSAHLALPRIGHLEQVMHMFGYLKEHPKRKLAFDAAHPEIDERRFHKYDWFDFYRGAKESIPGDMPEARGNVASTHCFVDANHAGNMTNRRSQTGILIFMNRAPIIWHSKRQNTVETSTFGSEITAMKNAIELIKALRYKLRMFGVPIEGPTNIFCDNEAVVKNCSTPESTLKKKHHSIAYHRNREAVAAGTCRIAKEGTISNLSDLFTKILTRLRRLELLDKFTY